MFSQNFYWNEILILPSKKKYRSKKLVLWMPKSSIVRERNNVALGISNCNSEWNRRTSVESMKIMSISLVHSSCDLLCAFISLPHFISNGNIRPGSLNAILENTAACYIAVLWKSKKKKKPKHISNKTFLLKINV